MSEDKHVQEHITTNKEEAKRVQDELISLLKDKGYGDRDIFSVRLALGEALANAIKHGNRRERAKRVHVEYRITDDEVWVRIEDEGKGFNPEAVPDPRAPENMERPCGRGLLLMHSFMNRVEYNERGNCITMVKVRTPETSDTF